MIFTRIRLEDQICRALIGQKLILGSGTPNPWIAMKEAGNWGWRSIYPVIEIHVLYDMDSGYWTISNHDKYVSSSHDNNIYQQAHASYKI